MNIEEVRRTFAAFRCLACDHLFADRIPPYCEDLPPCPICEEQSWLDGILVYAYRRELDPERNKIRE